MNEHTRAAEVCGRVLADIIEGDAGDGETFADALVAAGLVPVPPGPVVAWEVYGRRKFLAASDSDVASAAAAFFEQFGPESGAYVTVVGLDASGNPVGYPTEVRVSIDAEHRVTIL